MVVRPFPLVLGLVLVHGRTDATPFPASDEIRALLASVQGADLVFFHEQRPGKPRILAVAQSRATIDKLRPVAVDPTAYQRAIPAFRRADVLRAQGPDRLIAWELEVPLWNLEGKLWLRPRADGAELELVEGDFAPGRFRIGLEAEVGGTIVLVDGQANVREANWMTKRLAARSPVAEPALVAAAAYVLLRGLVLEAERPPHALDPRRYPTAAMGPSQSGLDGSSFGRAALPRLPPALVAAAVHSRADGRLDRVEMAVPSKLATDTVAQRLGDPGRWRALPGWRKIDVSTRDGQMRWEVDTRFPFVDFDATWSVWTGPPLRAEAVAGNTRGAVLSWDVLARERTSLAIFSLHPRLEKTGYLPRKFVEAEPLLEHGLSLGLAYVDAVSLMRALAP